jgi:hypothetical protein
MKEFDLTTAAQILGIVAAVAAVFIFHGDVLPWLRRVMSRRRERMAAADRSANQYVYQSAPASMLDHTTSAPTSGMPPTLDADLADMDTREGGMDWQPRLPRYPDERELIVYLATIRYPSGKYQKSANQIAAFVGGDRNVVLRIVRAVREGVPQYPAPLTPEQAEARRELALD